MLTLLIIIFILTIISFFIMIYLMVSDTMFTKKRDEYKKKLEDRAYQSLFIYMEESIKHNTPIDDNFISELKDAGEKMVNVEMYIYDEKRRRLHY